MIALGFILLFVCFAGVILFGAPYLPTLRPHVKAALDLVDIQSGGTLLELGCGDGKIVVAAAERGMHVVGYELNPILVLICKIRCWRYRSRVRIIWGNFWGKPWPEADAIFVFLLPKYMKKLDKKVMQYKHKPVKLVSFAFPVPGRQVSAQAEGVFRYDYH